MKSEKLNYLMKRYAHIPIHLLKDNEIKTIYNEFNKFSIIFMSIEQRDFFTEIRKQKEIRKTPNPFIIDKESDIYNDVLLVDKKMYLTKGEQINLNRSKKLDTFSFDSLITPEILTQYQQFLRWLNNQKRFSRRINEITTFNSLSKLPKKQRFTKFLELFFPMDLPIIYYDGFIPRTERDILNEANLYDFMKKNVFRSHGKKKEPYTILKTCLICSYVLKNYDYEQINNLTMTDLIYIIKLMEEKHYFHGKSDPFITDFKNSDEKVKLEKRGLN